MDDSLMRTELVDLDPAERKCVLEQIAAKGGHCEGCGGTDFSVGRALYLGFLFLDEVEDSYMVALSCRNPDCIKPHTGIRLSEKDVLLTREGDARAASWRVELPHGA